MKMRAKYSYKFLIKETFMDCLNETSLHGIPKIMKTNYHKIFRIFWMIGFLICISYGFYLVVIAFQSFFSYPTNISIKYFQETLLQFPAVAFYNMKLLDRKSKFTQMFLDANLNN